MNTREALTQALTKLHIIIYCTLDHMIQMFNRLIHLMILLSFLKTEHCGASGRAPRTSFFLSSLVQRQQQQQSHVPSLHL